MFVSFVDDPSKKGRMVKSLENMGFDILQFRLDGRRPDLTKMDSLLGLLSSESSFFPNQGTSTNLKLLLFRPLFIVTIHQSISCHLLNGVVMALSTLFQEKGLDALLDRIKNPPRKIKEPQPKKLGKREEADDPEDLPAHFCCPITYASSSSFFNDKIGSNERSCDNIEWTII